MKLTESSFGLCLVGLVARRDFRSNRLNLFPNPALTGRAAGLRSRAISRKRIGPGSAEIQGRTLTKGGLAYVGGSYIRSSTAQFVPPGGDRAGGAGLRSHPPSFWRLLILAPVAFIRELNKQVRVGLVPCGEGPVCDTGPRVRSAARRLLLPGQAPFHSRPNVQIFLRLTTMMPRPATRSNWQVCDAPRSCTTLHRRCLPDFAGMV